MKWAAYCAKEEQKRESGADVGVRGDVGVPPGRPGVPISRRELRRRRRRRKRRSQSSSQEGNNEAAGGRQAGGSEVRNVREDIEEEYNERQGDGL